MLFRSPKFEEEIQVVKNTTSSYNPTLEKIIDGEQILYFQNVIKRVPVPDNVLNYSVSLVSKTRPGTPNAASIVNDYISWGAGPRASQFLIMGAKTHAVLNGKYSPDIEDVKAVAPAILRHRIVKNYKAEAEGISVEKVINELLKS